MQSAAGGGAERHMRVACGGVQLRVDAEALERILVHSGLGTCAESANAAPRAAAVAAAHRHGPDEAQRARSRAAFDAPVESSGG